MKARYSRWDDSQDPFGDEIEVGEIVDGMADDLLSGGDGLAALRRLQARGIPRRLKGLDDLRRRLARERKHLTEDLDLSGPLEHVRQELEEIVGLERDALDARDDAAFRHALLDALPSNPARALEELMDYRFASAPAQQRFDALVEEVRREILDSFFRNLTAGMQSLDDEALARLKDMLADLNDMIAARDRGDEYDFKGFMERHGEFFPENPSNLDELLQGMAQRMAAMSRLLASMSPERRAQLAELARSVLDDLDLAFQVDRLQGALREAMPQLPWDEGVEGYGDEVLPASAIVDALERSGELEDLDKQLAGDYPGATLDDVDVDALKRNLGDDAVKDLERLREIERALERAGVLKVERGRMELTAKGARLIGERSLTRMLERIRREPTHRARGGAAEPTGATKPWTFGATEPISVERTVGNAVIRSGSARRVRLAAEDFELVETETRPRTATALLLDLSFSMPLRGHWVPAKRMALALHALIEGKYREDSLHLIGFSDYARGMNARDLAAAGWEEVHGTNMEHAFMLARRLLADDPRPIKQAIMVTDGEPTAHLEDGYAVFNWPPVEETIEATLKEALRLARSGIALNVFMLEDAPGLKRFMDRLTRLTGGKVFLETSSEIETSVMRRFLLGRRRAS